MKTLLACTAIAAVIVGASLAAAEDEAPKTTTAHGSIVSINDEDKSLVVSAVGPGGQTHDLTLVLDDRSKIVRDGEPSALADLKEKDVVTVAYREENSRNVIVD